MSARGELVKAPCVDMNRPCTISVSVERRSVVANSPKGRVKTIKIF